MRTSSRTLTIAGLSALAAPLLLAAPAQAATEISYEDFTAQVEKFEAEHPNDFVGLENLITDLGGEFQVSTNVTGPTSAAEAQRVMAADDAASPAAGSAVLAAGSLPDDSFTVAITSYRHNPGSPIVDVTGSWDWRDDFAGQTDPKDIATMGFNSGCGQRGNMRAYTYDLNGNQTETSILSDSGVSTNAVVWDIDARVSGFINSADIGRASVTYDTTGCTEPVQAGFIYEGNQGGSLTSVSAGFGVLSVGYSGSTLSTQKSTSPITIRE